MRIVHVADESKEDITSLVFTPNGSKLYAANAAGAIFMYDAFDNFRLAAQLRRHDEVSEWLG